MPQLDYGTAGHKGLSYSRRGTLHSCARKFQLENVFGFATKSDSNTFSYGHAVAAGVQEYFLSGDRKLAMAQCTKHWSMPWADLGTGKEMKSKRSIWYALNAVDNYITACKHLIYGDLAELQQYEIAYCNPSGEPDGEIPCIELQFRILLENDFVYEGHIDLILRHKVTGELVILELKTTGLNDPHDAMYENSDQALSYSIVLDKIVDGTGSANYKVFYLIYSSPKQEWLVKVFTKSAKRRFDWINNLIRDCELIEYYQSTAVSEEAIPYPTNGASCYEFFSPCKYFGSCDMDDDSLHLFYKRDAAGAGAKSFDYVDNTNYVFTLAEIIERQVELANERVGLSIEYSADEL